MRKCTIVLFALLFVVVLPVRSWGQIIITVAGDGNEGYSGDKGSALLAQLHWPKSVALDTLGNLYIADAENNCIRKVDTNGIITTVAGTGYEWGTGEGGFSGDGDTAKKAQLFDPEGVATDRKGNLYIADAGNNRIRKVDTNGIIRTIAGSGTGPGYYAGDGAAATLANLNMPTRIAVDTFGNVYIADKMNNRVRRVDTFGIITTLAGKGIASYTGDGKIATAATLNNPVDVAIAPYGGLLIADQGNEVVRLIDVNDTMRTFAGISAAGYRGDSGMATLAMLYDPEGLAVDDSGNVYIADNGNARIRKVNDTGMIVTIAGNGTGSYAGDNGPAIDAEIWFPQGLAVSPKGHLYIADQGNNRIRMMRTQLKEAVPNVGSAPVADMNAFPNPSRGTFMLSVASAVEEPAQVVITNVAGERVSEITTYTNRTVPIAIGAVPGVYFVSAVTAHGVWSKRVVVQP